MPTSIDKSPDGDGDQMRALDRAESLASIHIASTEVPWRTPLPTQATVWVDQYWKVQPVYLRNIAVDAGNRIYADYEFATAEATFTGRLETPPLGLDTEGEPVFGDDLLVTGLDGRQSFAVGDHLIAALVDWELPSEKVVWQHPLPETVAVGYELPDASTRSIRFTDIVVREDRIAANYYQLPDGTRGSIRTPQVVTDGTNGPYCCTGVQAIAGVPDDTVDYVYDTLVRSLVVWDRASAEQR